jgi:hypothetical protein
MSIFACSQRVIFLEEFTQSVTGEGEVRSRKATAQSVSGASRGRLSCRKNSLSSGAEMRWNLRDR